MPGSSSLFESRARRSANFVFRLHFFGEICAPEQCSQPPSYITSLSAKTRRPRNNPLLVFSFCSALNLLDIETRRTTHLNQPPTVGNTGFVPCAREKCPKTWQDLPMQRLVRQDAKTLPGSGVITRLYDDPRKLLPRKRDGVYCQN